MLFQLIQLDIALPRFGTLCLQARQLSLKVSNLLHTCLVLLVECLVLGDHALLILKHLVEVFELLGEENGLVPHHGVDQIQASVLTGIYLWQFQEALDLQGLP